MVNGVEKRGGNLYRLTVTLGYGEKGKQIRKRKGVKASSMREVQKLFTQFEAEVLD